MLRPSTSKKVYRKVCKTLLVDSRDRNPLQTQSSYSVTLPKTYESVYSVTLRSAEIPKSWYGFSAAAGNTSISVTVSGPTTKTITIPDGNYTGTTLAAALQAALVNASTGFGAGTFTVAYSTTTGLITITKATGDFTLNLASQTQTKAGQVVPSTATWWGLGYFLGFNKIDYTSSSSSLSGVFATQVEPFNYILMELDFINKEDETAIDNRMSGRVDGVFAKIPTQPASSGSIIYFREWCCPMNKSVMYPPLSQLRTLNIKFRFHDGTLINFNNAEHSFTLEFELLESNFDEYSSLELAPL
jgi:hypothetical protein